MLPWPVDVATALARWGVRTLGELASLPRPALAARLGPPGLAAHDVARGIDDTPWVPWTPPPFWEEAQELDWEIEALGPLMSVLERVVERLLARLTAVQLLVEGLELRLALAGGAHHARALALACPMEEPRALLTLLEHDLAARPPQGAITGVALQASVVARRAIAGVLGRASAPAARDLAAVWARLVALVGVERVGAVALADSHHPDAFVPAALDVQPPDEVTVPSGDGVLALRRLRPSRRVHVVTDGARRPALVQGALSAEARVLGCAGPWRLSGEWWDERAWARDEWDVVLDVGSAYRIFVERSVGQWFIEGVID
jgi:protein ImuB